MYNILDNVKIGNLKNNYKKVPKQDKDVYW